MDVSDTKRTRRRRWFTAGVAVVIDWAKQQTDVPSETIVLWGISQAGWVLPRVVTSRDDIDSIVAVSPAINWLRQGRYHLLAGLEHEGASPSERDQAIARQR